MSLSHSTAALLMLFHSLTHTAQEARKRIDREMALLSHSQSVPRCYQKILDQD
jgi:hypothetical protein